MFILPQSIVQRITSICRNFLWDGSEVFHKSPPVRWEIVCRPKKEGGLGIIDCNLWNKAAVAKLAWWVAVKKDRLWVKWVHQTYIKRADWIDYVPSVQSRWSWKQVCKVKDLLKEGFAVEHWMEGEYTIKRGYQWLLGTQCAQPWRFFVWNKFNVPKHAFIVWLIIQNRLSTLDRLFKMGITEATLCFLCGAAEESVKHLFFDCPFSNKCRELVGMKVGMQIPSQRTWIWCLRVRRLDKRKRMFLAMVVCALMYWIWRERNWCRFNSTVRTPSWVCKQLMGDVEARISGLR